QPHPRLGLAHGGARLLLARADLLVVENGDDLPRLEWITFAHRDLANPAGGLRGDRRVVAFDATAHRDDARGHGARRDHETPGAESYETEDDHRRDEHEPTTTHAHAPRPVSRRSMASPCVRRSWMCLTYAAASGGRIAGRRLASTRSRKRA